MFDAQGLTVRYGRRAALREVSVSYQSEGRICGLFGPNGAGKTTLMNCLVGSINRYQGVLKHPPPADIAYLPDKSFLYPWLTINQCFDLFGARHRDFRREVAAEIIDGFGLEGSSKVGQCSKGMSERLHLALVVARAARYYVLDEPLAAVDPFTRDFLVEMIRAKRRPDSTVLVSTHLISDVETLFEDVMMISDGRLLCYAGASEVCGDGEDLEAAFKRMVADHV